MALTEEEWRLAEALAVRRQHGDDAITFAAGRISTLKRAGDQAGVARWEEIRAQLDLLDQSTVQ